MANFIWSDGNADAGNGMIDMHMAGRMRSRSLNRDRSRSPGRLRSVNSSSRFVPFLTPLPTKVIIHLP